MRLPVTVAAPLCLLLAGCATQPVADTSTRNFTGGMPVDLSGSWERDYSRGDDAQAVLNSMLRRISRPLPDSGYPGNAPQPTQDFSKIVALARLAELITRPDVLTIEQSEYEISVSRKNDFSMLCEFYEGYAKRTQSEYGTEVCNWNGNRLESHLILPDGLLISHRFTISSDGRNLHVSTTVSSGSTRTPFTLNRIYMKFDLPETDFNCVETLSMKRVCSTGEIFP
ncbi:MAG: hypothetical protein O2805_02730 [Proteobacteria bacterium]|nr:hypothetical protein [Pseudomonadota bacterium]